MKNVEVVKANSNLKNKKGITLIALVVTIVVLLILAGVTILTLTGENGILKRANNAVEANDNKTNEEKERLGQYEKEISKFVDNSREIGTLVPNYNSKVSIEEYSSSTNQYTCTSDGYICIPSFALQSVGEICIYIDDFRAAWYCNSDSVWYRNAAYIPVANKSKIYYTVKGDYLMDNGVYFVPSK